MKDRLNINRLVFGALFGTVVLVTTGTVGCTTSRRATLETEAHGPGPDAAQTCQATLHAIDGAKKIWALEHRKLDTDIPTDSDLFGTNTYIRVKPICPSGGSYTLRAVQDAPVCSIPGHVFR